MYTEVVRGRPTCARATRSRTSGICCPTSAVRSPPRRGPRPPSRPHGRVRRREGRRRASRLAAAGIGPAHRLVVVHVSAGNPFRRWPASHFVELAVQLAANDPDRRSSSRPGRQEAEAARAIVAQARQRLPEGAEDRIRTGDEYSLGELRSLVARAAVYVGGDSGPLHVAATSDVPIVGCMRSDAAGPVGSVAAPGRADGGGRTARPRLPAVRPASVCHRRLPVPDGHRARPGVVEAVEQVLAAGTRG